MPTVRPAPGVAVTVWAGSFDGTAALVPPPASWAAVATGDVAILHISISPGATMTLPAAAGGAGTNRCAYFVEGASLTIARTADGTKQTVRV